MLNEHRATILNLVHEDALHLMRAPRARADIRDGYRVSVVSGFARADGVRLPQVSDAGKRIQQMQGDLTAQMVAADKDMAEARSEKEKLLERCERTERESTQRQNEAEAAQRASAAAISKAQQDIDILKQDLDKRTSDLERSTSGLQVG
jgi:hypothetical protein